MPPTAPKPAPRGSGLGSFRASGAMLHPRYLLLAQGSCALKTFDSQLALCVPPCSQATQLALRLSASRLSPKPSQTLRNTIHTQGHS